MNTFQRLALTAVSILFSATLALGATPPKADAKATAKPAEAAKTDAKAADAKADAKGAAKDAKTKIVDVNTATETELKGIPGIGDAYAAKIVAGRPYANKTQLKSRNILPAPVYEQVKDKIIAKQPKK